MPRIRKCFIRRTVVDLCFRTEEGLPLTANPILLALLTSILARAQTIFPVTICHFLVMSNHVHMLIVVEFPELVKDFVGYFKRESAHAINHLLGRKKHTIWCSGYDSPIILDPAKVLDRIEYCYTNPQRANLVETIDQYPNLSSWKAFLAGGEEIRTQRIARESIPALPERTLSLQEQQDIANDFLENGFEEYILSIKPDAWMDCFPELQDSDPETIKDDLIKRIRANEQAIAKSRQRPPLGAHALSLQNLRQSYTPSKHAKRTICLGSNKEYRVSFIQWFQDISKQAIRLFQLWKQGRQSLYIPAAFFGPGGVFQANVVPCTVPIGAA